MRPGVDPVFAVCAGGGVFLRLLCGASSTGEAPRGEGAPGDTAGVREEAEHPSAGGAGLNGPVWDQGPQLLDASFLGPDVLSSIISSSCVLCNRLLLFFSAARR